MLDVIFWWIGCLVCIGAGIIGSLWLFLWSLAEFIRWAGWIPAFYQFMRKRREGLSA